MKKNQEQRLAVIKPFVKELTQKLGRSKKELLTTGLLATDFTGNVRLVYEDGSHHHYQNAFLVKSKTHVGVFTEHCGYFMYPLDAFDDYVDDAPYNPVYPRE